MSINIGLINIGEAIEERIKFLKITQAEFANMLHITQPSVNAILKKSSIDTEKLKVISLLLDYNFFEDFCPDLKKNRKEQPKPTVPESENESETLKELIKTISWLRKENDEKNLEIKKLYKIIDTFTTLKNKEGSDNKKIVNV